MLRRLARTIGTLAWIVAALLVNGVARAEVIEGFEGLDPTWKQFGADGPTRVELQERAFGQARHGQGMEHIRIATAGGTYAYVGQTIPPARFIDELVPSLWVKADRTGVQLVARVVFPRSLDRRGQPRSLLLVGAVYERAGVWQQLTIADGAKQLPARLRVLRSQIAADVDPREAFVDLVAVNAYAGPGVTNLWLDQLEVTGFVAGSRPEAAPARPIAVQDSGQGTSANVRPAGFDSVPGTRASAPRIVGSLLMAEGRPFFPRVIEYRGEPFDLLRDRGFNAVRLAVPPSDAQLDEAQKAGIWLVAPAPPLVPGQPIGPRYERVLSWDLGRGLDPSQMESVRQHADLVRLADRLSGRPLLAQVDSGIAGYSRSADILTALREPLLSSQELPEYAGWLATRPRLSRPGTPWWMPVQSEPAESLVRQVSLLAPESAFSMPTLDLEQLRLIAFSAVASGARGLNFPSRTPLSGDAPAAKLRQTQLELLNLELANIEAWGAAGNYVTEIAATADVRVAVLAMDRSQLWVVLRQAPRANLNIELAAPQPLSFVVPGANDAATAYEITAGGLKQLRHKRVAGGVRVTLDEFSHATLIAFTDDPLVVGSLTRRLAGTQTRAARLRHEHAALIVAQTEEVERRLAQLGRSQPLALQSLNEARAWLARSQTLVEAGELAGGQQFAVAAERAAGRVRRADWLDATRGLTEPIASPLCLNFASLPAHAQLSQRLSEHAPGSNLLLGGACDDLPYMVQAGWRQYRSDVGPVLTTVELSMSQPSEGKFCLRLHAEARDPKTAPAALDAPPVWVVSAPVTFPAGQVVRISGSIRMPNPLAATTDGLMIFDSAGGIPLAQRVRQSGRWQPFVLYRAVEANQPLTVTFALSGLGEAWIDDVKIEPVGNLPR